MKRYINLIFVTWLALVATLTTSATETPTTVSSTGDEVGGPRLHGNRAPALSGTIPATPEMSRIWVYPTLNVTNTAWPAQRATALNAMKGDGEPAGNPPGNFVPLNVEGQLATAQMITLSGNAAGQQLRAGFRFVRTNQFRAHVQYELRSSDPQNLMRLSGTLTGLSVSRIGVDWKTGATHSSGDPLINDLIIAGVANGFISSGSADDEKIIRFLADNNPWGWSWTYTVEGFAPMSVTVFFNWPLPKLEMVRGIPLGGLKFILTGQSGTYEIRETLNPSQPFTQWKRSTVVQKPSTIHSVEVGFPLGQVGHNFLGAVRLE